jgi:hypothetical protein
MSRNVGLGLSSALAWLLSCVATSKHPHAASVLLRLAAPRNRLQVTELAGIDLLEHGGSAYPEFHMTAMGSRSLAEFGGRSRCLATTPTQAVGQWDHWQQQHPAATSGSNQHATEAVAATLPGSQVQAKAPSGLPAVAAHLSGAGGGLTPLEGLSHVGLGSGPSCIVLHSSSCSGKGISGCQQLPQVGQGLCDCCAKRAAGT